jgi:hypothetical protein
MNTGSRIIYVIGVFLFAFARSALSGSQTESRGRVITPVFERTVIESSPRVTTLAQRLRVEEIYHRPKTPDLVVFPGEHQRYERRRTTNLTGQSRIFGEANYRAGSRRNFGRDVTYY